MNSQKLHIFLDSQDKKDRYKVNSLKSKCILFENQIIQIGLKSSIIYDFYSSKYFVQLILFFGNKTDQAIRDFEIEYKGNKNIEMWIEERPKIIKEQSQYKERLLIGLFEADTDPWLTVSFRWQALDIRSLLIPISLLRFVMCKESIVDNYQIHQETFKYTEQSKPFRLGKKIQKSGADGLCRLLTGLKKYTDSVYCTQFDFGTATNTMFMVVHLNREEARIEISGNEEKYIPYLLSNLHYLLSDD